MFVLRVCGTLAVALTSIFLTTSAFACDQRFPWTCPASFDPPAVGVPVGDKEDAAAIKRIPKIAAPAPAAAAQPARSTAKRAGTPKAGPVAAARTETTPDRTKPTVVMVPEPVAPRPRPGPRDTFAERAWLPITTQDVANEIDLAAPAPVVVTTVPVSNPHRNRPRRWKRRPRNKLRRVPPWSSRAPRRSPPQRRFSSRSPSGLPQREKSRPRRICPGCARFLSV